MPQPLVITILLSVCIWLFFPPHISEIILCLFFSRLILLSILQMLSMLVQIAGFHSFLWLNNISLCIEMRFFLIHSLVGHLGSFHILAIAYTALMNVGMQISLCDSDDFISFQYIPTCGITTLCGTFKKNTLTVISFIQWLKLIIIFR